MKKMKREEQLLCECWLGHLPLYGPCFAIKSIKLLLTMCLGDQIHHCLETIKHDAQIFFSSLVTTSSGIKMSKWNGF